MKKELFKGLTEEQIAKVQACNNQEDLLKLSKEEGVELTNEQLEAINGGACSNTDNCPPCKYCGSDNVKLYKSDGPFSYKCKDCGRVFEVERNRHE